MSTATPLGRIVYAIEIIPNELLRNPSTGPADFVLVADKLAHAAAQCRTLAECQPEPAPARPIPVIGRARA